jgi:hypothetical protein
VDMDAVCADDMARVKAGAARVNACDPTGSGGLPLISVVFTWG